MSSDPNGLDRINSYAIVAYIPQPLAGYLDRLRQELVPNCFLRAHITVLPPRPISSTPESAWNQVRMLARRFLPFKIELTGVEVFRASDVIHVSVGAGFVSLEQMHEAMNTGGLKFKEPHGYHPHVTLAQDLKSDEVDELVDVARHRWAEFGFERSFQVETITFVQATRWKQWIDLGECNLGRDDARLVGDLAASRA
ncbi:MAG: 2'-5' RNA ligase family protein [Acidobacteriota bacterium]|nr:2'-5' RNA ligase family protein [Acidobacteriota bacterium]